MDQHRISVATVLVVLQSCASSSSDYNLYILHTNDIHARFEMFSKNEAVCKKKESSAISESEKCYGGVVRRAGFVAEFRKKRENVLLLDAGDQFQGSPWFFTYKGVEASHFLNLLNYDAMALGNHEFDNGVEGLIPFLKNVTVPILCSNLIRDGSVPEELKKSVKSHLVLEKGGRKIGIIGYIINTLSSLSTIGNLTFEDEINSIKRISNQLKSEGINIIIAVGHSGMKKDQEMARELADVDVIVGGHSHSLFYTGPNPYMDEVSAEYPIVFNKSTGVTLVVQAGSLGKYVGVLNLTFDLHGRITSWSGNPVVIDDRVPEDETVKQEMQLLEGKVHDEFNKVVGESLVLLDASENKCRIMECNFGNLYTDALVHAAQKESWPNVYIGLASGGSLRTSLNKGLITHADVVAALPFESPLVVVNVSGSTLLEMMEHSVAGFDLLERKGKFLQMSGLRVKYNMRNENGSRVKELKVKECARCKDYHDLDEQATYPVVMPSYMLKGGDGFNMVKKYQNISRKLRVRETEALSNFIKDRSPISPKVEGRILGMETFPGWVDAAASNLASASNVLDSVQSYLALCT